MTIAGARKRESSFHIPWKRFPLIFFFIIFIIVSILIASQSKGPEYFPIKTVKVIGARHLNHKDIEQSLYPFVNHGFFSVEVESMKDKMMQLSWVSDVSVRRIWPDQVLVTITEKNPIARWNEESLISSAGELFNPEAVSVSPDLPQFVGPEGKQIYIMQYYNKINTLLQPLHFKVARIELTSGHVWNVILNNGMKLTVDHKDFLTRFSHFVKVYPKLIGDRASEIDYVDLRYPNGLAVRWKSETQNV